MLDTLICKKILRVYYYDKNFFIFKGETPFFTVKY